MTIINLKEKYSDYYIREWKRQGLPLITERPPTTTETLLERFFTDISSNRKNRKKAIHKTIENKQKKKLDYRDYIKEEYQ